MASRALAKWQGERAEALDEILGAHSAVGGSGRGRRTATRQINQACVVLLTSQFQGFSRDLHSEAMEAVVHSLAGPDGAAPPKLALIVAQAALTAGRNLDRGNPNPGNIGRDFARLFQPTNSRLWDRVLALNPRLHPGRKDSLDALCRWRNAIAHQDLANPDLPALDGAGRGTLRLSDFKKWRQALNQLAPALDEAVRTQVERVAGASPW